MSRTNLTQWIAPLAKGIASAALLATSAHAQVVPMQEPSSEADIMAALSGGVPSGH